MARKGRLIFGGSFNPLHIGHMRLAIEAFAMLRALVSRVYFVPGAVPPHKQGEAILPFSLRVAILRASIAPYPQLACDVIEARLPAPSYTWRTLEAMAAQTDEPLFFLLGSADFKLLPEWRNGLALPRLCSLVIAPRGEYSKDDFAMSAKKMWPDSSGPFAGPEDACMAEKGWRMDLGEGNPVYLLPLPHLAISSTRVRKLWLCGENIDYLVPGPGLEILERDASLVRACWLEKKCSK